MGILMHPHTSGCRSAVSNPWWSAGPTSWPPSWPLTRSCWECCCWTWSGPNTGRRT